MSKFFEAISEKEIDEITEKGGRSKMCTAMLADLAIETALCAATGNATFCSVMRSETDFINKHC